ncbi:hypothetical protein DID88_008555 [Monilinia fructigena]|uniref:Uncharacterized protein n=1 Tax=Monilinia fructigena TaxID=38457 RepID=A0A395J6Q1_9HELO|nr:hypothetical protein DID88_008555 [Monilinia fructigena]
MGATQNTFLSVPGGYNMSFVPHGAGVMTNNPFSSVPGTTIPTLQTSSSPPPAEPVCKATSDWFSRPRSSTPALVEASSTSDASAAQNPLHPASFLRDAPRASDTPLIVVSPSPLHPLSFHQPTPRAQWPTSHRPIPPSPAYSGSIPGYFQPGQDYNSHGNMGMNMNMNTNMNMNMNMHNMRFPAPSQMCQQYQNNANTGGQQNRRMPYPYPLVQPNSYEYMMAQAAFDLHSNNSFNGPTTFSQLGIYYLRMEPRIQKKSSNELASGQSVLAINLLTIGERFECDFCSGPPMPHGVGPYNHEFLPIWGSAGHDLCRECVRTGKDRILIADADNLDSDSSRPNKDKRGKGKGKGKRAAKEPAGPGPSPKKPIHSSSSSSPMNASASSAYDRYHHLRTLQGSQVANNRSWMSYTEFNHIIALNDDGQWQMNLHGSNLQAPGSVQFGGSDVTNGGLKSNDLIIDAIVTAGMNEGGMSSGGASSSTNDGMNSGTSSAGMNTGMSSATSPSMSSSMDFTMSGGISSSMQSASNSASQSQPANIASFSTPQTNQPSPSQQFQTAAEAPNPHYHNVHMNGKPHGPISKFCMVCPSRAVFLCDGCPLTLCESCRYKLTNTCQGWFNNLVYTNGVNHNRNDAFLLRSDNGGYHEYGRFWPLPAHVNFSGRYDVGYFGV